MIITSYNLKKHYGYRQLLRKAISVSICLLLCLTLGITDASDAEAMNDDSSLRHRGIFPKEGAKSPLRLLQREMSVEVTKEGSIITSDRYTFVNEGETGTYTFIEGLSLYYEDDPLTEDRILVDGNEVAFLNVPGGLISDDGTYVDIDYMSPAEMEDAIENVDGNVPTNAWREFELHLNKTEKKTITRIIEEASNQAQYIPAYRFRSKFEYSPIIMRLYPEKFWRDSVTTEIKLRVKIQTTIAIREKLREFLQERYKSLHIRTNSSFSPYDEQTEDYYRSPEVSIEDDWIVMKLSNFRFTTTELSYCYDFPAIIFELHPLLIRMISLKYGDGTEKNQEDALRAALDDESAAIRIAALSQINSSLLTSLTDILIDLSLYDHSELVRACAIGRMVWEGSEQVYGYLKPLSISADSDKNHELMSIMGYQYNIRQSMIEHEMFRSNVLKTLRTIAKERTGNEQELAVESLAKIRDLGSFDLLMSLISNNCNDTRSQRLSPRLGDCELLDIANMTPAQRAALRGIQSMGGLQGEEYFYIKAYTPYQEQIAQSEIMKKLYSLYKSLAAQGYPPGNELKAMIYMSRYRESYIYQYFNNFDFAALPDNMLLEILQTHCENECIINWVARGLEHLQYYEPATSMTLTILNSTDHKRVQFFLRTYRPAFLHPDVMEALIALLKKIKNSQWADGLVKQIDENYNYPSMTAADEIGADIQKILKQSTGIPQREDPQLWTQWWDAHGKTIRQIYELSLPPLTKENRTEIEKYASDPNTGAYARLTLKHLDSGEN